MRKLQKAVNPDITVAHIMMVAVVILMIFSNSAFDLCGVNEEWPM